METLLIIASTDKGQDFIQELATPLGFSDTAAARNRREALAYLKDTSFDFIAINTPLEGEFGHELAATLAGSTDAGILFFVKQELADELAGRLESNGVFVLGKPVNRQYFAQMFRFLSASRRRLLGVKQENLRLQKRLDDMRLIDQAKFAVMECLAISEPQANRYIEKQAMDRRLTKVQIARELLSKYGAPGQ